MNSGEAGAGEAPSSLLRYVREQQEAYTTAAIWWGGLAVVMELNSLLTSTASLGILVARLLGLIPEGADRVLMLAAAILAAAGLVIRLSRLWTGMGGRRHVYRIAALLLGDLFDRLARNVSSPIEELRKEAELGLRVVGMLFAPGRVLIVRVD